MPKPLEIVVAGAGSRGTYAYASYALRHPDEVRIVGVAEPDPIRRGRFAETHDLDDAQCFVTWEDLMAAGQLGDAAIITNPGPDARKTGRGGDAGRLRCAAGKAHGASPSRSVCGWCRHPRRTGRILQICHVLRYALFGAKLHEIVQLGACWATSSRSNTAKTSPTGTWPTVSCAATGATRALSSPMILAKCCHDLDILVWNLNSPVKRLSSVGSLIHYRPESVGPEIPGRCVDNCPIEPACPFSAIAIYLDYQRTFPGRAQDMAAAGLDPSAPDVWPFNVITPDLTLAGRLKAIQEGPYGRCVYRCDNDVVDHQSVLLELESGASINMIMHGHSNQEHRSMRYDGTRATLRARALLIRARSRSTTTAARPNAFW